MTPEERGGLWYVELAMAAAALYAMSVPLSKMLMGSIEPGALAGLLYLGAGVGMRALIGARLAAGRKSASRPVEPRDVPYFAGDGAQHILGRRVLHEHIREDQTWKTS